MAPRILLLHNSYKQPGGEDTVFAAETALLREAGYEVHSKIVANDTIAGIASKARAFWTAPHDGARKAWMGQLMDRTGAAVVHIHNFFPLLTPAVHQAAAERGAAVVQSLHNYRLLCAGAQFLRNGQVCEKCLHGSRLWGVFHRCYRGSLPGSASLAAMQSRASRRKTWQRNVHRFIALTEFARAKFITGGLPADRIVVKPNFTVPPQAGAPPTPEREGALFVGRLSVEKGVWTLVKAWRALPDIPLTIAGDGPERALLTAEAPPNVRFVGQVSRAEVDAHMRRAACLVMPSIWFEGFPMTLVEAFANGLPVIGSRLGALEEVIEHGRTGLLVTPGEADELAGRVGEAFKARDPLRQMGEAARQRYLDSYSPQANLQQLLRIYGEARALADTSAQRGTAT